MLARPTQTHTEFSLRDLRSEKVHSLREINNNIFLKGMLFLSVHSLAHRSLQAKLDCPDKKVNAGLRESAVKLKLSLSSL